MATPNQGCVYPRHADTKILVLSRGFFDGYPATKVLMKPGTGRRHQLRLHCSEIGHRIVGDYTYSNCRDFKPKRMYLHSYKLDIPNSLEPISVEAGDPFQEDYEEIEVLNELSPEVYSKFEDQKLFDCFAIFS